MKPTILCTFSRKDDSSAHKRATRAMLHSAEKKLDDTNLPATYEVRRGYNLPLVVVASTGCVLGATVCCVLTSEVAVTVFFERSILDRSFSPSTTSGTSDMATFPTTDGPRSTSRIASFAACAIVRPPLLGVWRSIPLT